MMYRVIVDIKNDLSEVFFIINLFPFEGAFEKSATGLKLFVEGFSVGIKKMRKVVLGFWDFMIFDAVRSFAR